MPALLKIKRVIDNDVFKITFSLDNERLPESDKDLLRKFGEPSIDIGGTYTPSAGTEYTLPTKYIRVKSDLPHTQEFDSKSTIYSSNAKEKAIKFQETFIAKYNAAFAALRAKADTFTGEQIENI
jgi:hypothetical protein